jgi:hypothetical protein
MWSFPAFSKDKELVWLRATRSQHVSATRIPHQAAVRLGLAQSVTEAYQVQLRLSSEPRFVVRAEGGRDAGVHQIKERAEKRESSSAGLGHQLAGLGSLGTDIPRSDRARHQVAPEDESEGRSPDIPQRGAGPDEKAINHHP